MSELPGRTDVLVTGGGVIGTSIAGRLADTGASPVLLERGTLGRGLRQAPAAAEVVRDLVALPPPTPRANPSPRAPTDTLNRLPGTETDHRMPGNYLVTKTEDPR
ncbi:hypothetical protein [Streptomyces sp. NPDC058373]|uniref:hypothetical protein n=1 Tax=unclassified Streptomyces TaxID=2593676 RepID=UPI003657CFB2